MTFLTLALTLLLFAITTEQSILESCLINREDEVPCLDYQNADVVSPGPNQYTIHATHFQEGSDGLLICVKEKEGEILKDIEDLESHDIKFLFSPGAEQKPSMNYPNQILVEYNVQCDAGKAAFVRFDTLDLEPRNCYDGKEFRCQDYVDIDEGDGEGEEYCGNVAPTLPLIVPEGTFNLKFRSSRSGTYPGFRIFVTCLIDHDTQPGPDVKIPDEETAKTRAMARAEMKTIDRLVGELFTVALNNARLRGTSGLPPSSNSQNKLSLDSEVTIEAVRNKNSSNTIVRSVARSYISVAERIDPDQLIKAEEELGL